MSERTPEPWVLSESEAREFFHDEWYVQQSDDFIGAVAIVNGEANAHLIAGLAGYAEDTN